VQGPDYRGQAAPNAIKITHHKTGAIVWHPLEENTELGPVKFYGDAEDVLARLPRRGIAMILKGARDGIAKPYDRHEMAKIVRKLRDRLGLPATFTLDACRHGGMTELEEAELTDYPRPFGNDAIGGRVIPGPAGGAGESSCGPGERHRRKNKSSGAWPSEPDRDARFIDLFEHHLDERSCRSGCSGYNGASAKENIRHLIW
jgi:hypothetical protein